MKLRATVLTAATVATLLVCTSAIAISLGFVPGSSAYDRKKAQEIVRGSMLDGESARFRNVARHSAAMNDAMPVSVCGEVNGKNAFGAYVGFRRFIVDITKSTAEIDPADADFLQRKNLEYASCDSLGSFNHYEEMFECQNRVTERVGRQIIFGADWTIDCDLPTSKNM